MQTLTCGPYMIELFTTENCRGVIYAILDQQDTKQTWQLLNGHSLSLAVISGVDWNRELSPRKAPRAFCGGHFQDILAQIVRGINSLMRL